MLSKCVPGIEGLLSNTVRPGSIPIYLEGGLMVNEYSLDLTVIEKTSENSM